MNETEQLMADFETAKADLEKAHLRLVNHLLEEQLLAHKSAAKSLGCAVEEARSNRHLFRLLRVAGARQ